MLVPTAVCTNNRYSIRTSLGEESLVGRPLIWQRVAGHGRCEEPAAGSVPASGNAECGEQRIHTCTAARRSRQSRAQLLILLRALSPLPALQIGLSLESSTWP
ncbi:uncharacterized protein TrAtP1_007989 [Trichoderma atroviride]|uniref:uncharacterized protein n=1 Tax=Hypocrea atroviridis TaxID=63577 RepID=UPI003322F875|nr:hypothetical protein TrAtP1_007989 [Trichoderma atroviride]